MLPLNTIKVKTLSKLEKLLESNDIFETVRKINSGQIRSYNYLTPTSKATVPKNGIVSDTTMLAS